MKIHVRNQWSKVVSDEPFDYGWLYRLDDSITAYLCGEHVNRRNNPIHIWKQRMARSLRTMAFRLTSLIQLIQ